ncbi:hypothetical protein [Winogradskyella luteola]|uniref:Uncharacterized protein n=1 Tax=Winogradskyella luteola TaxID=2828330 RepID=A0A9X1F9C0_9FLAO|nr:hypothetical protein [Winogradskyella luteola]MBV7268803.1 hypothetical protein [Winogradskyella luteola]
METGCKEMTEADILKLINNNELLNKKLEDLGIVEDNDKLKVELKYSELLTNKEKAHLFSEIEEFLPEFSKSEMGKNMFFKYGAGKIHIRICYTDAVCDYCYNDLMEIRRNK